MANIPIEGELTIKDWSGSAQEFSDSVSENTSPVNLLVKSQLASNEIILPFPLGKRASEKTGHRFEITL